MPARPTGPDRLGEFMGTAGHLHHHLAPIGRSAHPMDVPGAFQAVDRGGHCAPAGAAFRRKLASRARFESDEQLLILREFLRRGRELQSVRPSASAVASPGLPAGPLTPPSRSPLAPPASRPSGARWTPNSAQAMSPRGRGDCYAGPAAARAFSRSPAPTTSSPRVVK